MVQPLVRARMPPSTLLLKPLLSQSPLVHLPASHDAMEVPAVVGGELVLQQIDHIDAALLWRRAIAKLNSIGVDTQQRMLSYHLCV